MMSEKADHQAGHLYGAKKSIKSTENRETNMQKYKTTKNIAQQTSS